MQYFWLIFRLNKHFCMEREISVFGLSTVMTVTVIKQFAGWGGSVFDIDKNKYIYLYIKLAPPRKLEKP